MSSKKDPAFLFYSKDWLEGTAELLPEEKGVYIDLLCHQHQKGSLPTDTKRLAKIVGLAEQEFLFIWTGVKLKFTEIDNRFYNRKLTDVITERSEKGKKNKIIGTLASVIRLSPLPYQLKQEAKKGFNYEDFWEIKDQTITEAVTEWFNKRLKSIENGNANANNNVIEDNEAFLQNQNISPKMLALFKSHFPSYQIDLNKDFKHCLEIAYKIAKKKEWSKDSITNGKMQDCLDSWETIIKFIKEDDYYSGLSLDFLNRQWSGLIQKMHKPKTDGTHKQSASSKSAGAEKLLSQFKNEFRSNELNGG